MTSADTEQSRSSRHGDDDGSRRADGPPRARDEGRSRATSDGDGTAPRESADGHDGAPRRRRRPMRQILSSALSEFNGLVGRPIEGVSAFERTDDGWRVDVDVVELERIPDTTSLLATYELELDEDGDVLSYRRTRRYHRASTEDA